MIKNKIDMLNCPFCGHNRKSFLVKHGYDVERMYFYEDPDFSISSDLSPLVTGHLLVIPITHYAGFCEIVDNEMLLRYRRVAERLLGTRDLLLFEHGAVLEGEAGASVDHAHMHILPRPKNVNIDFVDRYITESGYVSSAKIPVSQEVLHRFFIKRQPYIYYELQNQKFAYPVHSLPHQFLRMMLQTFCEISYNWKIAYSTDACRDNVNKTIEYVNSNIKHLGL